MHGKKIEIVADSLNAALGRQVTAEDVVTESPLIRMAAWLDRDADTICPTVPAGWHLLFFLSQTPQRNLGPEGGTPRDDVVPPIPLTREMWAGSRLRLSGTPRIGDQIRRIGSLHRVESKQGRSGSFVRLTVRDEIFGPSGLVVTEEMDLIFRDAPDNAEESSLPSKPVRSPQWSRSFVADAPFLFRFSALTYNSHRIHYDQAYVMGHEKYPELLVHGPLQEILLLDLLSERLKGRSVIDFSCRASSPLFAGQKIYANGEMRSEEEADLWITDEAGIVCMTASARIAPSSA